MVFISKKGFLTDIIQKEYIKVLKKQNVKIDSKVLSLNAEDNNSNKLYFWQLYSILGQEPIINLITAFYTKVFNDEEEKWFRDVFVDLGPLKYHIKFQTNFWLDIMGSGQHYKGGLKRLSFKHNLARELLTVKGAQRWMYHMQLAIKDLESDFNFDKRIVPCLYDFLKFFMDKYSVEFDFNFIDVRLLNSKL